MKTAFTDMIRSVAGALRLRRSTTRRTKVARRVHALEALEPRAMMAADPVFQDSSEVDWREFHDQTSAQFSSTYNTLKSHYLPVDIEIDDAGFGNARIASIWNANTDHRKWAEWRNLDSATFGQKWETYRQQGYRLADQETYQLGGTTLYAGIWIQNREGLAWASKRNMSASSYQAFVNQYERNYLPVDVDVVNIGGTSRYSAIFVANTKHYSWKLRSGLTSSQFSTLFNTMKSTHRVSDIESYTVGGQTRYAVIWVQNKNHRSWVSLRDMNELTLWNRLNRYADEGYRPVDVERYDTSGGVRYAAVWRQDGTRLTWSLRKRVDTLALKEFQNFSLPGMGVTVSRYGKFLYRRGFGHADISSGKEYSSLTINRLASVSKAVAGVLSLELQERGLVNLSNKTRTYIASMPIQHQHTLLQLLSNRAGTGHYEDWGTPSGSYATALAATKALWNKPLLFQAGKGYHYSTHGYTFLGAALEGATHKQIDAIVKQYLTDAFGLTTLRSEDRSQYDRYRSALYTVSGNNKKAPSGADNLSWKRLGGGLESSSVDLARLGQKLLAHGILSTSSLTKLWTAPDSRASYGLGWDLGRTAGGARIVAKSGAQNGANTYLLIYPDRGIVITVMSNRKSGGQSASKLAKAIGSLMVS